MRKIELEIYKLDELSEEIQEKVIEKNRDINIQHEWWDYLVEEFIEEAEKEGFNIPIKSVCFDMHGQGSGVAFNCKIDVLKFLDTKGTDNLMLREKYKEGQFEIEIIRTDTKYSHEHTMNVSVNDFIEEPGEEDLGNDLGEIVEGDTINNIAELGEEILERARELSRELYNKLEKECDYLISDEAIKETLILNEYEFEKDGSRR